MQINALPGSGQSILKIFEKGASFKPPQIEQLLESFPTRNFWLVGDSGAGFYWRAGGGRGTGHAPRAVLEDL